MVTLLPDLSGQTKKTLGYRREMDVLELLQRVLPDGYFIFHNIEWQSLQKDLLKDMDQCLYGRLRHDLPGTVNIQRVDNFRCPQMIVQAINAFGLTSKTIKAKSPWHSEIPRLFIDDGSEDDLLQKAEDAIHEFLQHGTDVADVAVLTMKGMLHSKVMRYDNLANYSTKHFTGKFLDDGQAKWTNGLLLMDSVYRCKGQSAAAVELSEVDFNELSLAERTKLFVGMTRGR